MPNSLTRLIALAVLLCAAPAFADSDDMTAARARHALVAAHLPDVAHIAVTSFNGEVDLEGTVHSEHVKEEAARLLGGLPGITAVRNDLEVR